MLVLSCKPGQKIIIHNSDGLMIEVKVVKSCRQKVVLGFKAPEETRIDREKVYEKKQEGAT